MIFGRSEYKRAVQLYESAMAAFSQQDYDRAKESARQALNAVQQIRWPRLTGYSRDLVLGNLHYFYAHSVKHTDPHHLDRFDELVGHYRDAMLLFARDPQWVRWVYAAAFDFCDLAMDQGLLRNDPSTFGTAYRTLLELEELPGAGTVPPIDRAGVMSRKAMCHGIPVPQSGFFDLDQALELLGDALRIYEEVGHRRNQILANSNLSKFYFQRFQNNTNRRDIERAILCQERILNLATGAPKNERLSEHAISLHLALLGRFYLHKGRFDAPRNIDTAYEVLNTALAWMSWEESPLQWVDCALDFIESFSSAPQHKVLIDGLQSAYRADQTATAPESQIRLILYDRIDRIFEILGSDAYPTEMYSALRARRMVRELFGEYVAGEHLSHLASLSSQLTGDTEHEALFVAVRLEEVDEVDRPVDDCITMLEAVRENVSSDRDQDTAFDFHLTLGSWYSEAGRSGEAYESLSEALRLVRELKRSGDVHSLRRVRTLLQTSDRLLFSIPGAFLKRDGVVSALQALEEIRFHPVTPYLEELYLIEQTVTRKKWIDQRNVVRMAELVLHSSPAGKAPVANDAFGTWNRRRLDSHAGDLKQIDAFYSTVAQLKEKYPAAAEQHFLESIADYIGTFESWVLIALPARDRIRLTLIPPNARVSEIHVSEDLHPRYVDVLRQVMGEGKHGWMSAVMHYTLPEYEDDFDVVDELVSEMREWLWINFGAWVDMILTERHSGDSVDLVIVPYGALTSLPCCMASASEDAPPWLDKVNISYSPSLYALWTLQERRRRFRDKPRFGFLSQPDPDFDSVEFQKAPSFYALEIERELCCRTFDQQENGGATARLIAGDAMLDAHKNTSYWHIAAHGTVSWLSYTENKLDKHITPDVLASLGTSSVLRLVALSACSVGLAETMDRELAPESYMTELLKCGAIGIIGALWPIPEVAATFLMVRFYRLHLEDAREPASALAAAQRWLRDVTLQEIVEMVNQSDRSDPEWARSVAFTLEELGASESPLSERPFEHPLNWAGFVLVGQ